MGTTYKCLIVDDEKPAHLVIKSHISNCDELVFSDSAFNGKEAIQLLTQNKYDLVFLDIDMPLINGIEVLQMLSQKPATIITTAYNHFAFEAYQQDAVDYLLKPISFSRFLKAVEKVKRFSKPIDKQILTLIIKTDGITRELELDSIAYFQSIGNYVKIFFKETTQPIIAYDSLKNILERIPSDRFIQTHKSFIVNTQFVKYIENDIVVLNNSSTIQIGRKYELLVKNIITKTNK